MTHTIEITAEQYRALQHGYCLRGSISMAHKWDGVVNFRQYNKKASPLGVTRVKGGRSSITKTDLACTIGIKLNADDLTLENVRRELQYIEETVKQFIK